MYKIVLSDEAAMEIVKPYEVASSGFQKVWANDARTVTASSIDIADDDRASAMRKFHQL